MPQSKSFPTASILIPIHNRKSLTLRCIASLSSKFNSQYSIIVIDDGSTDGTSKFIREKYPFITILPGDGNLWWTGAIRLGMEYAVSQGSDFIVWLNNDCLVDPYAIEKLISSCTSYPDSIVGCQGFEGNQPKKIAFGGKIKTIFGYRFTHPQNSSITPCDLLSGNLVCMPSTIVNSIGYPDTNLTPHYGGDSLFLIRAKNYGYQLFVDPSIDAVNLSPSKSSLYPTNLIFSNGGPFEVITLVFTPQSGLCWRVWWNLNWEAYRFYGIVMFTKKYTFIFLYSILRICFYPLRLLIPHFLTS